MVESTNHPQDVERLFSWLKAPMVHYREFAPQVEIAEAVAAWPVVHRAAVEAGVVGQEEPAPHGSVAARERIARERLPAPAAVVPATPEIPASASPAPGATEGKPADEGIIATLGERLQAARAERAVEAAPIVAERQAAAEASLAGFEEPAPPSQMRARSTTTPSAPPREQGGLFAGEYRGREHEPQADARVADRRDRSLDAVFSRLAEGRDRLPDPRARGRTTPGLGGVFSRLR